jgi:CheY-like chemotaxis protein
MVGNAEERKLIIVVDFNQDVLHMIQSILETHLGCQVLCFTSPAEVLSLLKTQKPDLLTTSLMLPEMTGGELLEKIRQDPANDFPLVVISSAAKPKRGLPEYVAEYIRKPFEPIAFADRIQNLLTPRPGLAGNEGPQPNSGGSKP